MSRSRLRIAVIGQGHFAQAAVLPAIEQLDDVELGALVSGSRHKLDELADRYGAQVACHYDDLDGLLASGRIDAVYIAVPNDMHAEMTLVAARHGVHVLCEKPMAPTEAECMQMIHACEQRNVKLMIAYRLHFERGNLHAIEAIHTGKIGEPRAFTSVFSQQVREGNTRLSKDVGGGAIYDMGVYCINAARYLFRAEPDEVFAWNATSNDPRFREVPEMTCGLLRFPENRLASFTTSFGAADRSVFEVIGTKGVLTMDPAYEMTGDLKSTMTVNGHVTKKTFKARDQFAAEIVYFSDCVQRDMQPEPSGQEGLADVRIIRALLKSAQENRPISVPKVEISRRPDLNQDIAKQPIAPPHLVKAAAPGAE